MKTYYQLFNVTDGLDFLINKNWTGEQAFAAVQLLEDLRCQIITRYSEQIADYLDENPDILRYYEDNPDDDCGLPF
jgi:hypothetical protein